MPKVGRARNGTLREWIGRGMVSPGQCAPDDRGADTNLFDQQTAGMTAVAVRIRRLTGNQHRNFQP